MVNTHGFFLDRELRRALYHWSRTSIQHDAVARACYDRLRARGIAMDAPGAASRIAGYES